jgi:hypothetical protein
MKIQKKAHGLHFKKLLLKIISSFHHALKIVKDRFIPNQFDIDYKP